MFNLVRRFSLVWLRFTPLEEFLLGVLQEQLPEEPRRLNQRRIDLINHVVRLPGWTAICFYQKQHGKVVADEESLFPCRSHQEIILAEIRFSPAHKREIWTSKIYAVSGHMFSIETRPSPKPIAFASPFTLRSVKLIDDPMQEFPATLLQRFSQRLPPDFDELAGRSISGWDVFTSSQIYSVALDDTDYLLVAECGGDAAFLGIRIKGKSKDVYFLSHDGQPRKAGSTLQEAIEKEGSRRKELHRA